MRKTIFLLVILTLLLSACVAQTGIVQYADPTSTIRFPESWKIYAVSEKVILVQGYLQTNDGVSCTLFRSENSGKDWKEVYRPPKPVTPELSSDLLSCGGNFEFAFLKDGTGWLVSTWGAFTQGQYELAVDTTKDFGKTWLRVSEVEVIPSYEFLGTSFITAKYGQINLLYTNTTSDRVAFLITTDGGITWQETGSLSLREAFWNGNKSEYFSTIEKYVDYNFPKTPYETGYGNNCWKIEFQQEQSEVVVFKKIENGEWARVSSFQ